MSPPSRVGVGDDEAVAGRVRLQPADDEVHPVGQAEAVAADLEEIAVGDQRLQEPPERGRSSRGTRRIWRSSRLVAG